MTESAKRTTERTMSGAGVFQPAASRTEKSTSVVRPSPDESDWASLTQSASRTQKTDFCSKAILRRPLIRSLPLAVLSPAGQFRVFGRKMEGLHGKMEALHGKMEALHGKMEALHGKMETSHGKMETSHSKMETSHGKMESLHGKMEALHGKMEALHGKMESLHGGTAGLPRRMDSLHVRMDVLRTRMDGLPIGIGSVKYFV